ncbi:hypothetical protein EPN44_16115 [bacterium]|nr:MAG: hypothetical protein EPN44_16115 [bacterium]
MAEILKQRPTCMLQINTGGAWRNVLTFDPARRAEILASVALLANTLGASAKWCLHHPDGKREWLHAEDFQVGGWLHISATEPAPHVDVMVSAYDASDREGIVFMAWRNAAGNWFISGSDERLLLPVYAYCPVMNPAPAPAAPQVAA